MVREVSVGFFHQNDTWLLNMLAVVA